MLEDLDRMQTRDLMLSGQGMHVWKGGAGPGVLLLHAAWGDAEMSWSRVWGRLARFSTVVAPDLPGFGCSSPLFSPALSGMAAALRELLETLHLDRVMVIGNSFGAAVAIQFAIDNPRMVSQLVVVNGGYLPAIPGPMRTVLSLPGVNQGFRALVRYLTFSWQALNRSFVSPEKLPAGFLDKIQQNAPAYSRVSFDTIMNLKRPLARPAVPTLLLWGARDGLATLKQARTIQKWIPESRLVLIDDAGHMPQVERPQEFMDEIASLAGEQA